MEIINELTRKWYGNNKPFLIHPDGELFYTDPTPTVNMDAAGDIFGYFYEVDQDPDGVADQTSDFTSETSITLDSLADGTWYIHAVPMDSSYQILDEQHSTYQFNISAAPPAVSSSTHPNQDYVYSNANPVINIAEVTGLDSYYYIFDQKYLQRLMLKNIVHLKEQYQYLSLLLYFLQYWLFHLKFYFR